MQVLLVNPPEHALPPGTADLLWDIGCEITQAHDYRRALEKARRDSIDAVLLAAPGHVDGVDDSNRDFVRLVKLIDARRIAGVIFSHRPKGQRSSLPYLSRPGSLLEVVDRNVSASELRGRVATIDRYHGELSRLQRRLKHMERLGQRLGQHFREVEQEMRLAGRLQRDFLPQLADPIRNARFAAVYRPASWVSGDMFDVFRIDEDHTGFYIADAVGHGMAASLLTMFIKRAIVPKRIEGEQYTVLTPTQTMGMLNETLAGQSLPNCQFVTAFYAILNHQTLELRYSRGGHPYPLLLKPDGQVSELKVAGGLLGLFNGEEFPTATVQLEPQDKLILYTDGLEFVFPPQGNEPPGAPAYQPVFAPLAHLPIHELLSQVESRFDDQTGSLNPTDDITILGVEILPQ